MQSQARRWSGSSGGASPASSRALSHCGNALRGGGGSAGSSSSEPSSESAPATARRLLLLLLEREHGLVAVVVELDLRLLFYFGLDLLLRLDLGLDGHGRAARLRLRDRALRRTRLCDGERSRLLGRLGLDDARRSEAALAVVVRVVVAVERVDVDDLGPRFLRRRD